MSFSTLVLALFVGLCVAGYTLEDDYLSGGDFFDLFTFFTDADPTAGFVQYVDESTASSAGYINSSSSNVYIGTDSVNVAGSGGRQSVRITSNKAYNTGLVILDLEHMPGGQCGTWPAFWMLGPDWPTDGEIDIIEGVNSQVGNDLTLHTSDGCSVDSSSDMTGTLATTNCYIDATGQSDNAGCGVEDSASNSYGNGFNSNNGGVYATEITTSTITIWFFPRGSIPSDISSGSPDPTGWGTPTALFSGCDVETYFTEMSLVFDLTFCGSWAGEVWTTDATCAPLADTCVDYVQNTPSAFQDSYWSINSLQVFSSDGSSAGPASSAAASSMTAASTPVTVSSAGPSSIPVPISTSTATTFAFSTKPAGAPSSYPAGNASYGAWPTYPAGTASAFHFASSGTGLTRHHVASASSVVTENVSPSSSAVAAASTASSASSAASEVSSPPEVTVTSSVVQAATITATTTYTHTHHWHGGPHTRRDEMEEVKRHIRQHKRHGGGDVA